MLIKRVTLESNLFDFVTTGNGVVVGSPGVGKSFSIKQLLSKLEDEGAPPLVLKIDELEDGSKASIKDVLELGEHDLISKLRFEFEATQAPKCILFFDAYDAARNFDAQKRFLGLIKRCINELNDICNVIVSVRTYDAQKSHELLDLFLKISDENIEDTYQDKSIPCRHFKIPELNPEEIKDALSQIEAKTKKTFGISKNNNIFPILSVPFNIWLLEKIAESGSLSEMGEISSEVQLLNLFWERRAGCDNQAQSNILIGNLCRQLVESKSMSIRKYDFKETLSDKLFSNGVLTEVSTSKQRIAFSHNILFDFAVSLLLLDDNIDDLVKFLQADKSRIIFLRPSLIYYFSRLWHNEKDKFWNNFGRLLDGEEPAMKLISRFIPTYVLVKEARSDNDFDSLFKKQCPQTDIAIQYIFQSYRAILRNPGDCKTITERDTLWAGFLNRVSNHMNTTFAWEHVQLCDLFIERNSDNESIISHIGEASRNVLQWIWNGRTQNIDNDSFLDNVGYSYAVPNVAKTFASNPEVSERLLQPVLDLIRSEPNFPINYIFRLTHNIKEIYTASPTFAQEIYKVVFDYKEISVKKTNIGGPILNISGNRRQDYELCKYTLSQEFKGFLAAHPTIATITAIRCLNAHIIKEHIQGYLKENVRLEDVQKRFSWGDKKCKFIEDGSYIWDRDNDHDDTINMATTLFQYLENIINKNDIQKLDELLTVVTAEFKAAFFWRRLLELASKYPSIFSEKLYDLTLAYPIQTCPETMRDLANYLKAVVEKNLYSKEELIKIEQSILDIKPENNDDNTSFYLSCQARLLAQFPIDKLSDNSKLILQQSKVEATENKPFVEFSSFSEPYTEEKWLQDQGVDPKKPHNEKILSMLSLLKTFSEKHSNSAPTLAETKDIIKNAIEIKAKLFSDDDVDINAADPHVVNSAWRHLGVFTETLCKCNEISSSPDSSEYQFCKMVLLSAAQCNEPEPNAKYDNEYSSPSWSPAPRNSAAMGLPLLLKNTVDQDILDAIRKLAIDPVPSVRFLTMTRINLIENCYPDQYWELMQDISKIESNKVVLNAFINSVGRWVNFNESKVVETLNNIDRKLLYDDPNYDESYLRLLARLLVTSNNEWATSESNRLLTDPLAYGKSLDRLAFELMVFLDVKNWKSESDTKKTENAIRWLGQIITVVTNEIKKTGDDQDVTPDETKKKQYQALYAVIHEIISRTYFNSRFTHQDDISLGEVKEVYFRNMEPLLDQILIFALSGKGILGASTAHYFMQFLNSYLEVAPDKILAMASKLAHGSQYWNYHLDSMGIREVVSLTEKLLADHKDLLQNDQSLNDLLNMLDIFVTAGWTEAVNLIWRLDEVFR